MSAQNNTLASAHTESPVALALRISERLGPNDWSAVLAASEAEARVAAELEDALRTFTDAPNATIERTTAHTADDLLAAATNADIRILAGVSNISDDDWARIDRQRSQLHTNGRTVLLLTAEAMNRLARYAPNLHSWLGGAVWTAQTAIPELSPRAIADRLRSLRAWSGRDDDDVIALAERGELPGDPEYAEWLVLLDRADLLRPNA